MCEEHIETLLWATYETAYLDLDGIIFSTLQTSNSAQGNIRSPATRFKSVYPQILEQYFTLITP